MITAKVQGLSELSAALKQLPPNIGRNVLRGAAGAGASVIRKEARLRAPIYTGPMAEGHPPPGTLKRAILQSQQRALSSLVQQTFHIGVRAGRQNNSNSGGRNAYYWRWVEFGTVKMTAKPFLRPAFEVKKQAAVEAIRAYLLQRLPREFQKLGMTWRP